MMNLGSRMNLEEVEVLMAEADPKGEGAIDVEEFAQRICPVVKK
jgi:Ca2+-binding EF-hand superfamily protein